MRIAVVGAGYVGLVSGACLAKMGNDVICVDVDEAKINALNNGVIPIYESGLSEIVAECRANGALKFSVDIQRSLGARQRAVGTPMGADGQADLRYVLEVAKSIGQNLTSPLIVVDKSTVSVGTAKRLAK